MLDNVKVELPAKEIYEDLARPSVQAIGSIISLPVRAIRLCLAPFEQWIINGENNLDKVAESVSKNLKNVDESKITTPAPYVAIPALQAISYCMDNDELRNIYAKLLSTAMNIDTYNKAHPSYTEIIKQLSPSEAKILKHIEKESVILLCDLRIQKKSPYIRATKVEKEFYYTRIPQEGMPLYENLALLKIDGLSDALITTSLENLNRLGIVSINDKYSLYKDYSLFTNSQTFIDCMHKANDMIKNSSNSKEPEEKEFFCNAEFAAILKSASITNFGKSFIAACIWLNQLICLKYYIFQ